MNAVDTNVLVRLLTRDHSLQVNAAEEFVAAGAWVSLVVLVEAVWVLTSVYAWSAAETVRAVEALLNQSGLVFESAPAIAQALDLFHQRPTLGFTDCLIVELARSTGNLPLGTFDRRLGAVPGAKLLR